MTGRLRWSMVAVAAVVAVVVVAYLMTRGADSPTQPVVGTTTTTPAARPPTATGTLTLTVAVAPPNIRTLRVAGAGFAAGETVRLSLNDRAQPDVRADATGAFTTAIQLSPDGHDVTVRAVGATSGRTATATATF